MEALTWGSGAEAKGMASAAAVEIGLVETAMAAKAAYSAERRRR